MSIGPFSQSKEVCDDDVSTPGADAVGAIRHRAVAPGSKEWITMEAFVLTLVLVSLLIIGGMVISVHLYRRRLLETGHFRQVRRSRSLRPLPDGTTVEETVVETIDEEAPIEQA